MCEREICGFPGYTVDTDGVVRSRLRWRGDPGPRIVTSYTNQKGYQFVRLHLLGVKTTRRVHQLVALAFMGPRPDRYEVRHLNGDKTDNRAANLAYGTAADNAADRESHGTTARGERAGNTVLTDGDISSIRALYSTGSRQKNLGATFGVSRECIASIVHNRSWRHLPSPPVVPRKTSRSAA
jgi:hypothetical protein